MLSGMARSRLELALTLITGAEWRAFEKFAAEFLAVEYPELRTTASASGDGGRDGFLHIPGDEPNVAVQVSVRKDWDAKIRETVTRLGKTFPDVDELIYATNQTIGAEADSLRKKLRRDSNIILDVRDSAWFIERENGHPQRQAASEKLAAEFVDPLLKKSTKSPFEGKLSSDEAKVALLQLVLDSSDSSSDRNLTKSCFDSLVVAALRASSANNRLRRAEVADAISKFVPAGEVGQLSALVDGALARVSRKGGPVKHFRKEDEFHLSFEESSRLDEQTARFILDEQQLESELADRAASIAAVDGDKFDRAAFGEALRLTLEGVLLEHSERFAASVSTGETVLLDSEELLAAVRRTGGALSADPETAITAIQDVLAAPSPALSDHLRRLSDSYTLFAFLRQTPDVQKVVLSVFADGDLWLDTSAILPLLAELLIDNPEARQYTQLIGAARDAGIKLHVTPGVIEEVERHLNRCVAFGHTPQGAWNGRVPFLYSAYILSGRASSDFLTWQDSIRGKVRPEEDVRDYLEDEFGIVERSLEELSDAADIELRAAVQELWMEQHEARRGSSDDDPFTVQRLVAHDVENTIGVLELRKSEHKSPMGYRTWWLTMDKTALRFSSYLKDRMGSDAPSSSPALSPDFLSQYLRLGPMRSAVEKRQHVSLPILTDISRLENVPQRLVALSDQIRQENQGLDERLLRRKVRDRMDVERTRRGTMTAGGSGALEQGIKERISSQ